MIKKLLKYERKYEELLVIILVISMILISGCKVDIEDEKPMCQVLFENGTFKIELSDTSAESCDEYAGAMIMSKICHGGLYCEQVNTTCICKRFE